MGNIVALDPVIYTDAYLFIPKFMKREKESENAEIMMGDYRIQCNLGTKLLFNLYVYGISIMAVSKKDIPKEFRSMDYERIKGTRMATQMVVVLSKKPRTDVE